MMDAYLMHARRTSSQPEQTHSEHVAVLDHVVLFFSLPLSAVRLLTTPADTT